MTQHEGHPPVAYLDKTKFYSKWVHIHIPFSGPHEAMWVEDRDGTNGHWEGSVCDTEGGTIPGWQDEVLFWQEIPLPMQWEGRVKLPQTDDWNKNVKLLPYQEQLLPGTAESVRDFKTFYAEYIAQFRKKMEEGSQITGVVPDKPSGAPKEEPETVYTLDCFDCRKCIRKPFVRETGWTYGCQEGRETQGANPMTCPGGDVQRGFQIGGYYTHMWFETEGSLVAEGATNDPCLNWMIASDGEFPTENGEVGIEFHLCDFTQLEQWVAFWGKELRKRGWITEVEDAE